MLFRPYKILSGALFSKRLICQKLFLDTQAAKALCFW